MPSLGYPHRHSLFGDFRAGNTDKTQNHRVPDLRCIFEKSQFVANRIGENRLKNKTLPLFDEFASERVRDSRGDIRINSQVAVQKIGIDKAQTR